MQPESKNSSPKWEKQWVEKYISYRASLFQPNWGINLKDVNSKKSKVVEKIKMDELEVLEIKWKMQANSILSKVKKIFCESNQELTAAAGEVFKKLVISKELGCHPAEVSTDALYKKSKSIGDQLILEEELSRRKKNRKKGAKPSAKKQQAILKPSFTSSHNSEPIERINLAVNPLERKDSLLKKETLTQFALKLLQNSNNCPEHFRVKRWEEKDPNEIRKFLDRDSQGQDILRYQSLTDEEILEQRARHFLPGTEKLLKSSEHRDIYTFPTDRGRGVVAQLFFKNKPSNGVLYFGVKEVVFHKYFEDVNFKDSKLNVFLDRLPLCDKSLKTKDEDSLKWTTRHNFELDINKEGILQFIYDEDHHLCIFPINKDLLKAYSA